MELNDFRLLAIYNKETNSKMNEIIKSLSEEKWNKIFSGYYKSIHELCSHIFIGDYRWLTKFMIFGEYQSLDRNYFNKDYSFSEILFENINEYISKRNELDKIMVDFTNELTEDDLNKKMKFTSSKGITVEKQLRIYLLHLSHHETHHRGMISLYLEMVGKENNYTNYLIL
jgi:uncharacterized damage-inducible protein DinB